MTSGRNAITRSYPRGLSKSPIDVETSSSSGAINSVTQYANRILIRWKRRIEDLDNVKKAVQKDHIDYRRNPELLLDAKVRCSKQASCEEKEFLRKRSGQIIGSKTLYEILKIDEKDGEPRTEDIPTVAIGGSGGGYRAMFGFMASLDALQSKGCLDLAHWLAGVSGSCWTIAAMYTVGRFEANNLLAHYKRVADEGHHPMSRKALDTVARSNKGGYFLLAPLLAKLQSGVVGIGIMDMYATLTTTYQLLSRLPRASTRLSGSTFQFSRWWNRLRISEGLLPMPIFTAVRVRHRKKAVTEDIATSSPSAESTYNDSVQEADAAKAREKAFPTSNSLINYQWWEMNPLEIGSSDEGVWIPSWSYGRKFVSGNAVTRAPEISMSLLLGQVTSAPAGPMTGYISTLLATIPRGTIMSFLLSKLNNFVMQQRWENRWGNPIRGADEPNPLYGQGTRRSSNEEGGINATWESKRSLKLIDSGLSNNLPNHVFTSLARKADIIISFDQSSDVQSGIALSRLNDLAIQRDLIMIPEKDLHEMIAPANKMSRGEKDSDYKSYSSEEIIKRFEGKYAQIFHIWYKDDVEKSTNDQLVSGLHYFDAKRPKEDPHTHFIYCPLLPHPSQPGYDPATASFSTNYNLIWSSEEVDTIAKTARNNAVDFIIPTFLTIYRNVYDSKSKSNSIKTQS